jgi:DNA-binding FadR family transcriptional regulator
VVAEEAGPGGEVGGDVRRDDPSFVDPILHEGITSGKYPSGRVLPPARLLSQEHGVLIGSVKRAIEILRSEGLVRTVSPFQAVRIG